MLVVCDIQKIIIIPKAGTKNCPFSEAKSMMLSVWFRGVES
jgi:hypothetical protein